MAGGLPGGANYLAGQTAWRSKLPGGAKIMTGQTAWRSKLPGGAIIMAGQTAWRSKKRSFSEKGTKNQKNRVICTLGG